MPRTDDHRWTRVTIWCLPQDVRRLHEAIADDLIPSVREVHVRHEQTLPPHGDGDPTEGRDR